MKISISTIITSSSDREKAAASVVGFNSYEQRYPDGSLTKLAVDPLPSSILGGGAAVTGKFPVDPRMPKLHKMKKQASKFLFSCLHRVFIMGSS